MVACSVGEQHFLKGGIAQELRTDGRKRLTYRDVYVETGVIPQVIVINLRELMVMFQQICLLSLLLFCLALRLMVQLELG